MRDPWLRQRQALHDAANWLTVLLGHLEALRTDPHGQVQSRHLELARRAARAAHRLCALPPEPGRVGTEIDAVRHARRLLDHVRPSADARKVELTLDEPCDEVHVVADVPGFEDAVLNLLRNGIEVSPPGGVVRLCIQATDPGFVAVHVTDAGPGIPPELREELGRPGTSTKAGTDRGLGLSRVGAWLEAFGTRLEVGEGPAGGARVGFVLPAADPASTAGTTETGGRRILLVEDDHAVAEVISLLLQADGHQVRHEPDLGGARVRFAPGRFDLVLCDQNLPDGAGIQLLQHFAREDPATACFLVTGDPESVNSAPGVLTGVLAKPLSRDDLRRAVAALDEAPDSSDAASAEDA